LAMPQYLQSFISEVCPERRVLLHKRFA